MRRYVQVSVAVMVLLVAASAPAFAATGSFVDDDDNVHEANIEAIAQAGITKGCNPPVNDRYCPEDPVTRGQMAAFLSRALDLPDTPVDFFVDDDASTFEADINRLAAAGITKGCNPPDNDRYCPDDPVTRGQMAAFLVRAFGYTDQGDGDLFVDDDGSVFEGDIDRLAVAGVTLGCNPPDNDRYCPDDPVRRDQMASFLARALDLDPITPTPAGDPRQSSSWRSLRVTLPSIRDRAARSASIDTNMYKDDDVLAALDTIGTRDLAWISVSHYDADHLGGIEAVGTVPGGLGRCGL